MPFVRRPDGAELYHELHGDPEATPLALVEGLGGDVAGWRRSLPGLQAEHRVIAFDLRGNGRSSAGDGPTTMAVLVDDTVAVLDETGVDAAHVYGLSLGGMVALQLALTRPARVRSLVLGCTNAGPRRATRARATTHVPKDRPYLALYSERFAREQADLLADDVAARARRRTSPLAARRQREAARGWDVWDRLGEVAGPTLVVHGTDDRLVDVDNARRMAAAIPGARLALLEGAGHLFHVERPEETDRIVLAFLREVDGR